MSRADVGADEAGGTAPPGARRERVGAWAVAAGTLAVVGAVAVLWRPLAPPLPPGLPEQATFDAGLLATIERYRAPRLVLAPIATLLAVLVPVTVALLPAAGRVVTRLTGDRAHAPWHAGLVAAAVAALSWVATLPLAAWLGLVHERRWGFRTSSAVAWWRDQLVVAGGRWLLVGVGVGVLVVAVRRWPSSWPYRLTVAATAVAAVLVVVHPVLLQPLLLSTVPLPPGPVRDAVAPVLAEAGMADVPVVVADASRRTTRVNALVTGLGPTERVVLHDTLVGELTPDQVAGVVAHELAHAQHADLARGTLATATAVLPGLLLLRWLLDRPALRRRTGARSAADPRLALVVVAAVLVAEVATTPVVNAVSRRLERAADARALELGADPAEVVRTVRTFVVRDLSAPDPAPLVQGWYGTHPSPVERIRAAVAAAERTGADLPSRARLEAAERTVRHPRAPRLPTGGTP